MRSARARMENDSLAGPRLRKKKWALRSLLHDFHGINREPVLFYCAGKVESNVDLFVFAGIAR